jgi:hypothetical protein
MAGITALLAETRRRAARMAYFLQSITLSTGLKSEGNVVGKPSHSADSLMKIWIVDGSSSDPSHSLSDG